MCRDLINAQNWRVVSTISILHWGHCRCRRAAQFYYTRWRHTAACQCSAMPEDSSRLRQQLSDCVADVTQWYSSRRLQLNTDKTEAIWIGSRAATNKLLSQDRSLTVGTSITINLSDVVRDLGVLFDFGLTMKKHIAKVAAVCFFHIRWFCQIRRRVGKDVTIRIVLALITPRLDYCNSVLGAMPQSTLEPLQRVQNAVLMFRHTWCKIHWLPVRSRVQFKLCTLMHAIHNKRSPSYLSDPVQTVAPATTRCGLWSSATTDYTLPRTLSKFGERAFAYAGPAAWNRLPEHIRRQFTPATFRRHLKTCLFAEVFNTT